MVEQFCKSNFQIIRRKANTILLLLLIALTMLGFQDVKVQFQKPVALDTIASKEESLFGKKVSIPVSSTTEVLEAIDSKGEFHQFLSVPFGDENFIIQVPSTTYEEVMGTDEELVGTILSQAESIQELDIENTNTEYVITVGRNYYFSPTVTIGIMILFVVLLVMFIFLQSLTKIKVFQNMLLERFKKEFTKEQLKDIQEANEVEQGRLYVGKSYVFVKDGYFRKMQVITISQLRWMKIKRLPISISTYFVYGLGKSERMEVLFHVKGKNRLKEVMRLIINQNKQVVLGEIQELKDQNVSLDSNHAKAMEIIERTYKENTFQGFKEEDYK